MSLKKWHCIQVGDEECFDRDGSYRWREARKMATATHRENPDEEVRIVTVRVDDRGIVQEIETVEVIYEGASDMGAGVRAAMWNFFH